MTLNIGRTGARWRVAVLLAAPFLVAVAALRGLTQTLPTYHGVDEFTYHLPTVRQFAAQLPTPDLVHYPAAQTPLFHLLVAVWGLVVGSELWRLRVFEVVVSWVAALVLYRVLRRYRGFGAHGAGALAGLFVLSPYVFGQSFILVTDNLGLLLALLAIERLLAFSSGRGDELRAFAGACGWIALALLTRQSYVWLCALAAALLVVRRPRVPRRTLAGGAALLVIACAPLGALVLAWHGLVPPTADPASCGLCGALPGRLGWSHASPLLAPLFTFALLGIYGPLLHGRALVGCIARNREGWRPFVVPVLAAAAGAAVLAVTPLAKTRGDEGFVWRVAVTGPQPLGTSWVFWLLVPLGCAIAAAGVQRERWRSVPVVTVAAAGVRREGWRSAPVVTVAAAGVRREGWRSLPVLAFGAFVAAQLVTRVLYEKYFDPFVLLFCLLALRPEQFRSRADAVGPAVVLAMSLGYVLAFAVGWIPAMVPAPGLGT